MGFQKGGSDEESDVPIPKRKWGEDYMNGLKETIEEEFGEICDESVASLSDESSKEISTKDGGVSVLKEEIKNASSTTHLPIKSSFSSDEVSSSSGPKKQKKMKKEKGGKAKKNKSKESLPPLKGVTGGLPPLKGKRMFLRGLPLTNNNNKSPEKLGQVGIEFQQNPDMASTTTNSSLRINTGIENRSIEKKSSGCDDLINKAPTTTNNKSTIKMNQIHQQSEQTLVVVKSQKSRNLLGDLPPLPTATSSSFIMVSKSNKIPDVFGGRGDAYDESEDVEEYDLFGDDDIDALLGGLDQFDAQRKSKQ